MATDESGGGLADRAWDGPSVTDRVRDRLSVPRHVRARLWPYLDSVRYGRQRLRDALPEVRGVPYLFLLPYFTLFSLFLAFPIFYTIYLSFHEYQGVSDNTLLWVDFGVYTLKIPEIAQLEFVGLQNYARILGDATFWQSMLNTGFIFVVQVPLMIGLAMAAALALNATFVRFKGPLRTVLALPVSANLVAYSTIFLLLLNEQLGFINYLLGLVGLGPVAWLSDKWPARFSIIGAMTWRWTGYNMIILLAGLQNVPEQLYEAAEIDGATRWEKFRYVTLPQMRPVLLFVFVLSTIGTFKLFSEPWILTRTTALESTQTIVMYIYRTAFVGSIDLGYASALAWVLVLIVSALSMIQIRIGGDQDA